MTGKRGRKRKGYSDRQKFAILREEMRGLTQGAKSSNEAGGMIAVGLTVLCVICASMMTISGMRALLTAATNEKINPFAPMTYTNTQIEEPNTTFTTSFSSNTISIAKKATVKNLSGTDKKPVFVRVSLTYSVYDSDGVNITASYPLASGKTGPEFTPTSGKWEKKHNYYYYTSIIDPGERTDELFGSNVTLTFADSVTLPDNATVEIDVIADTVQAVSHDSSKWERTDYEADDVNAVWGVAGKGATAAINAPSKAVTWTAVPAPQPGI